MMCASSHFFKFQIRSLLINFFFYSSSVLCILKYLQEIELSEDEVSKRKRVRSSAEDFKTEEDTKKLEERVGSLDKSSKPTLTRLI